MLRLFVLVVALVQEAAYSSAGDALRCALALLGWGWALLGAQQLEITPKTSLLKQERVFEGVV